MSGMVTWIAEIGVNHLGQYNKALSMVKKAKHAGATAVKFQKYNPVEVLGRNHPDLKEAYQLSWKELTDLSEYSHSLGLKFGCSVFNINDIPIVDRISDFHKIAGRMNRNTEFIAKIESCKKETVMSVQPDMGIRIPERFKLMWCVREYPTSKEEILKYPYSKSFGLSSHCPDWTASLFAVQHGATVIENHVKEFENDEGCDMSSSLSFEDYTKLIRGSKMGSDYAVSISPLSKMR